MRRLRKYYRGEKSKLEKIVGCLKHDEFLRLPMQAALIRCCISQRKQMQRKNRSGGKKVQIKFRQKARKIEAKEEVACYNNDSDLAIKYSL